MLAVVLSSCAGKVQPKTAAIQLKGSKYYLFGIHMLPARKADSIHKAYGVQIVNSSCVLDAAKLASNKRIDSLMTLKYQQSMTALLNGIH